MTSSSGTGNNVSRVPGYDLQPGQIVLNTWEVLEPLGRGGMGAVYRVYHRFLQKEMAMKTLRPDQVTDVNWKRFQTEAKAIAKLVHPNIIQIFDMGTAEEGQPFYTMELLNGQGLDEWIRYEPITAAQALTVFRQVATALAFAHERGIVHRDIKPANIVLTFAEENKPPVVKVVDFGIAKLGTENQGLTKEGEVFGSPLYMSPEQATGQKVDHRSDIYSFGCALYETLTGFPPFKGKSAMETMMMHLEKTPLPIERARPEMKFPPGLSAIVQMMLAKDPDERYSNASQIAQDLMQIERGMGEKVAYRLQTASQMVQEQVQVDTSQVTQRLTNSYGRAEREIEEEGEEEELEREIVAGAADRKKLILGVVFLLGLMIVGCFVYWSSSSHGNHSPNIEKTIKNDVVSEENLYRLIHKFRLGPKEVRKLGCRFDEGQVYYLFPSQSIGKILDSRNKELGKASGLRVFPVEVQLQFISDESLPFDDDTWSRFGADDFYSFSFPEKADFAFSSAKVLSFCVKYLRAVKSLELSNLSEADCKVLKDNCFTKLEKLKLHGDSLLASKDVLRIIGEGTHLRSLAIPMLTDSVLPILEKLERSGILEELSIEGCNFDAREIKCISSLTNLKSLSCVKCKIGSEFLKSLTKLRNLQHLDFSETVLSLDAMAELPNIHCLEKLEIAPNFPEQQPAAWSKLRAKLEKNRVSVLIAEKSAIELPKIINRNSVEEVVEVRLNERNKRLKTQGKAPISLQDAKSLVEEGAAYLLK